MKDRKAFVAGLLCLGTLISCSTAGAQPAATAPPGPSAKSSEPQDTLGRTTPRGTVVGFLLAGREGNDDTAAQYLNTRATGKAAALLAHQLFVVMNRRLPTGTALLELSDRPEGQSPSLTKPNQTLIGSVHGDGGDVEIIIERVDRGNEGQLWLFSSTTLRAIPRMFEETNAVEGAIPEFLLEHKIARIPLFQWLAVLIGMPLLYLFTVLLNRLLSPLAGRLLRRIRWSDRSSDPELVPMPVRLLIMALVIRWAVSVVNLPLLSSEFWSRTSGIIMIAAIVWILVAMTGVAENLLRRRLDSPEERGGAASILRLGRRVVESVFISMGILAGLRYLGVNITAAMAGLGVGGIAIALAAQKTLENVIGGVSVVFDRAVNVGELVKVGDQNGFVEHIGLRSTRIRTHDRTVISIPNGQLANASVENISIRDKFWLNQTLHLQPHTSATIIREVLERVDNLLSQDDRVEPITRRVRFLGFRESSLDIELFAYVLQSDFGVFLATQQDLMLDVMDILQSAGARLAFRSQIVYQPDAVLPSEDIRARGIPAPGTQLQNVR